MKRVLRSGVVLMGLVSALCAACGSDDGGSGFSPSVSSDKELGSLSEPDVKKLCDDVQSYASSVADSLKDVSCRSAGIAAAVTGGAETDADARVACKTAYDKCLATPADTDEEPCERPPATCKATVGELTACLNAYPTYVKATLPNLPACNTIEVAKLSSYFETPDKPEAPAACKTYDTKCPGNGIIDDGSSSGDQ